MQDVYNLLVDEKSFSHRGVGHLGQVLHDLVSDSEMFDGWVPRLPPVSSAQLRAILDVLTKEQLCALEAATPMYTGKAPAPLQSEYDVLGDETPGQDEE